MCYKCNNNAFIRNFLRCESLCDEGYYGEGCLQKCNCHFCNSTNGECYNEGTTENSMHTTLQTIYLTTEKNVLNETEITTESSTSNKLF